MKNDGTDAQDEFVKKIEAKYHKRAYVHRLTDTKEVKRFNKKAFVKKTPADFVVSVLEEAGDYMFYAEVKSTEHPTAFNFSMFTPGQIIAMTRQAAAGGAYLVFIYHTKKNQWFRVGGDKVLAVMADGKKSIKWEDLDKWVM